MIGLRKTGQMFQDLIRLSLLFAVSSSFPSPALAVHTSLFVFLSHVPLYLDAEDLNLATNIFGAGKS
jgi:hypothetical protein